MIWDEKRQLQLRTAATAFGRKPFELDGATSELPCVGWDFAGPREFARFDKILRRSRAILRT